MIRVFFKIMLQVFTFISFWNSKINPNKTVKHWASHFILSKTLISSTFSIEKVPNKLRHCYYIVYFLIIFKNQQLTYQFSRSIHSKPGICLWHTVNLLYNVYNISLGEAGL